MARQPYLPVAFSSVRSWVVSSLCALAVIATWLDAATALEPVPDKLVVLTFDDSVKSHFTIVRPILKKYGFGGTFFVTEGFDFKTDKRNYMTWEEIAQLHRDGFEIGNHTRDHVGVTADNLDRYEEQVEAIRRRCEEHGIPSPVSFAYPGNSLHDGARPILAKAGIRFARRGGQPEHQYKEGKGFAYEPGLDHPLLIPSAGDARPDWSLDDFIRAVTQARRGRIAVLQFHGVPDGAHPWVDTPRDRFEAYMKYLAVNEYQVIAMRDLARYVDPRVTPHDAWGVVRDRQAAMESGRSRENHRRPADDESMRFWLENMVRFHRFTPAEVGAATGLEDDRLAETLKRFAFEPSPEGPKDDDRSLRVLPYPGGRHPRIGFRDGAIRPQRETKISVFAPWDEREYVVLDIPEAIRWDREAQEGLLYLAHTHVPTTWEKQGIELEPLEWRREADGWSVRRRLPNGVTFGTKVVPGRRDVRMEMWITNGSDSTLRGLRVQNCVMLKGAPSLAATTNDNKVFQSPYAACRSADGERWVITAWQSCDRAWGNASCPCLHSDPRFPDCEPGQTRRLSGILAFHRGEDVQDELRRLEQVGWRSD